MVTSLTEANLRALPGNEGANSRTDPRSLQKPYLTFQDILNVAEIRPVSIDKKSLGPFAQMFNSIIKRGASVQDLMKLLHEVKVADAPATKPENRPKQPVVTVIDRDKDKANKTQTTESDKKKKDEIEPFFTQRNIAIILVHTCVV